MVSETFGRLLRRKPPVKRYDGSVGWVIIHFAFDGRPN